MKKWKYIISDSAFLGSAFPRAASIGQALVEWNPSARSRSSAAAKAMISQHFSWRSFSNPSKSYDRKSHELLKNIYIYNIYIPCKCIYGWNLYLDHPPTRSPMSSQAAPRPYFQASCLALWDGPGTRCLGMTGEQNTLVIVDQIKWWDDSVMVIHELVFIVLMSLTDIEVKAF